MLLRRYIFSAVVGAGLLAPARGLLAWGYDGHRIVNQVALAALPKDFPAFVREPANAERIGFLAGEPDRWRNTTDLPLKHREPDHQIDLEDLTAAGLSPASLTEFRQVFAAQMAAARAAHPEKFAPADPIKNKDHTAEQTGFIPWTITEYYGRLRSAFTYLRTFEELGTPAEIANAQANIVYLMGILGHFVGDGAQPLHTTIHYNGWAGENPRAFTTWKGFHSHIDAGFIEKTGITFQGLNSRIKPATALSLPPQPDGRDAMFVTVMNYLLATHERLEPLYELDKANKFRAEEPPGSLEGRAFIEGQLLSGGQMLAAIWMTAWQNAQPDTYLRTQLLKRQTGALNPSK